MNKLVLIDGNAILHRAYYALPPLTDKRGESINAVYGFVSMLLRVIQDLKPTHIAVAFDRKEPTFRHEVFGAYQAQRPMMDKELSSQFEKAKEVIRAFGIPIYEKAGYEADDVIGTIATLAIRDHSIKAGKGTKKTKLQFPSSKINEVIVVTGDRDLFQLINDKVKVYMPIVGLSNAKLMGKKEVIEKIGVNPEQIPDYKALVGDPSDNYPGVPGIGPKTAIQLLKRYVNLENIYSNLDDIQEKLSAKLKAYKESAGLYLKLATVVTNVPIEFDLRETDKWRVDNPKVLDLFSEIGFKTLAKRVKEIGKILNQEKQMSLI